MMALVADSVALMCTLLLHRGLSLYLAPDLSASSLTLRSWLAFPVGLLACMSFPAVVFFVCGIAASLCTSLLNAAFISPSIAISLLAVPITSMQVMSSAWGSQTCFVLDLLASMGQASCFVPS